MGAARGGETAPGSPDPPAVVRMPLGVRIASEWSWRLLLIAAAAWAGAYVFIALHTILIPVMVAVLITALVIPVVDGLVRLGLPRGAAAGIGLVGLIVVVAGLLALVGQQIAAGFEDLAGQVAEGMDTIRNWLVTGPFQLSSEQLQNVFDQARDALTRNQGELTQGALRIGTTVGHVLTGFFLVLFATFFFLYDGNRIWSWLVRLFPRTARGRVDSSGRQAWTSLTAFVRATIMVALVDAIGIGVIAFILKVPLAFPIAVLVFIAAFIPIIGALVSGAAAVLVALVGQSPWIALLMLIGVLAVQQLESHVLQPFLMGRLVRLHPLAVILAIGAGGFLAGILGALFAVPVAAVVSAVVNHLAAGAGEPVADSPVADSPEGSAPQVE